MDTQRYADWDGDGFPDHVMGPDGLWHAFNPQTGESLSSTAPSGGNNPFAPSGSSPVSSGGGTQQRFSAPPTPPADFGSGETPHPAYRNGQLHPAWGGAPLVPGGTYRGPQGSSGGYQQQVSTPSGATAGPFGTHPAYGPSQHSYGGDSSSGGGGGLAKSLIGQMRSNVESKLSGMFGGGSSSYSSSSYPSSGSSYTPYVQETPKMRGFARHVDPTQALGLYTQPQMLMPKVAPGLDIASPKYGDTADLPMAELALLQGGKKLAAPSRDPYGNLTSKDHSLSDFTNSLANMYDRVINREKWFDYGDLTKNLMTAPKNSALGAQFLGNKPQAVPGAPVSAAARQASRGVPASAQISSFLNATDAIFGATMDPNAAAIKQDYASALADQFASRFLNRPVKRMPSAARWAGSRLFYN